MSDYKQFYEEEFDRVIDVLDSNQCTWDWQITHVPYRFEWVLSKCGDGDNKLLDVGCLNGLFSHYADNHGFSVVGVDVSDKAVEKSLELNPNLKFSQMFGEHLNFEDNSFDVVIASEVIEHVPDPVSFLKELGRVARKKVILTTPIGLNYDCPSHINHWMDVMDIIQITNELSGSSQITKINKAEKDGPKTIYGIEIFVNECKKCGKCCYYIKDGKSVPCKYLKDNLCSIYETRLGTEIDKGIFCGKRKSFLKKIEGCSYV